MPKCIFGLNKDCPFKFKAEDIDTKKCGLCMKAEQIKVHKLRAERSNFITL